jgi:sec-independent protein translocase protein TatA
VKPGLFQILIILLILLVLFGRGRISETMGDLGKGFRRFKQGLGDDEPVPARLETADATPDPAADKIAG